MGRFALRSYTIRVTESIRLMSKNCKFIRQKYAQQISIIKFVSQNEKKKYYAYVAKSQLLNYHELKNSLNY